MLIPLGLIPLRIILVHKPSPVSSLINGTTIFWSLLNLIYLIFCAVWHYFQCFMVFCSNEIFLCSGFCMDIFGYTGHAIPNLSSVSWWCFRQIQYINVLFFLGCFSAYLESGECIKILLIIKHFYVLAYNNKSYGQKCRHEPLFFAKIRKPLCWLPRVFQLLKNMYFFSKFCLEYHL